MPAKPLVELATAAVIKNIKGLESIGDFLPYESVQHILAKVDNAYQLRRIELNSPQIQGETGELWLKLIEREFPLEYKAKAYKPQNPSKWYRVWEKYKRDHDQSIEESEAKLRDALAGLKQSKEENTSKIVERKYLPRAGRMRPKRPLGPRDSTSSALTFNAGSRTKTVNGASVMRKVRREVKEIRTIHGNLSKPIRAPSRPAGVNKAPSAMVNDKRIASQPSYRPNSHSSHAGTSSAVQDHEDQAAFISDSESDEDGQEMPAPQPKPARQMVPPIRKPTVKPRPSGGSALQRKFGSSMTTSSTQKSPVKKVITQSPPRPKLGSPNRDNSSQSTNTAFKTQVEQKPANRSTHYLPRQSSPPPTEEPQSPTKPAPPMTNSAPKKRKAVDIFMRPKKR